MEPAKIKNATHCLNPPPAWDTEKTGAECVPLWVIATVKEADSATFTSAWRPTKEELAALNAGHGVMLTLFSPFGMLPVMLEVTGEPLP